MISGHFLACSVAFSDSRSSNADYYGYRDEDDGVIVPLEEEAEKKCMFVALLCCVLRSLVFIS